MSDPSDRLVRMRMWTIYALVDPRTEAIRYVGWAFNPQKRLADHVAKARKADTHKDRWLRQLAAGGAVPVLQVLETGCGNWAEAECRHIAAARAAGADLTNSTAGGEGIVGYRFSAETRERMAAAKRGRKLAPDHVAKVVAAHLGRVRPPEVRAAISAAKMGHVVSVETRAKLSAAALGFRHTDETRAKIGAAGRGRVHSEQAKAMMRAAKIGKPLTDEHRAKLSVARRARVHATSARLNSGASS